MLEPGRGVINGGVGIHLAQTGERIQLFGRRFADQADITRREKLYPA